MHTEHLLVVLAFTSASSWYLLTGQLSVSVCVSSLWGIFLSHVLVWREALSSVLLPHMAEYICIWMLPSASQLWLWSTPPFTHIRRQSHLLTCVCMYVHTSWHVSPLSKGRILFYFFKFKTFWIFNLKFEIRWNWRAYISVLFLSMCVCLKGLVNCQGLWSVEGVY